jgi:hypothetical protein
LISNQQTNQQPNGTSPLLYSFSPSLPDFPDEKLVLQEGPRKRRQSRKKVDYADNMKDLV